MFNKFTILSVLIYSYLIYGLPSHNYLPKSDDKTNFAPLGSLKDLSNEKTEVDPTMTVRNQQPDYDKPEKSQSNLHPWHDQVLFENINDIGQADQLYREIQAQSETTSFGDFVKDVGKFLLLTGLLAAVFVLFIADIK